MSSAGSANRKLSARPKHHAQDPDAIEAFKKGALPPSWTSSKRPSRRHTNRYLVPGRGQDRAEEQDHEAMGEAGTALMRAGEVGDRYHVIVSGEVEIIRDGRVVDRSVSPNGVGELALLHDIPRTATVRAVTEVDTLAIAADAFLLAVMSYPPIRRPAHWEVGDVG